VRSEKKKKRKRKLGKRTKVRLGRKGDLKKAKRKRRAKKEK
jgi:hypothetical protein